MREIVLLQGAVLLYSLNTVCGKYASMQTPLSVPFFLYLGLEVALLGCYALIWQQAIKKIDLSVAYANKAAGLVWSLLFSALLFGDSVTMQKIGALVLIIAGCILLNLPDRKEREEQARPDAKGGAA